jgi:uncharacterized protein YegP (UPF0339 family)
MANMDDYLPCKTYLDKEPHGKIENITKFFDKKTDKFYFGLMASDKTILLRSEGYTSSKGCENGILSVLKNIEILDRLSTLKEGKKYFVILKAGNNKQIGRSCDYSSDTAASEGILLLTNFGKTPKIALKEKKLNTTSKSSEVKSKTNSKSIKTATSSTKTSKSKENNQPISPKSVAKKNINTIAEPMVTEEGIASKTNTFLNTLLGYEFVDFYLNKSRIIDAYGITGFAKFEDGKHYFAVYNPDGSIYLRSIGFDSIEERDNAFDLMESAILLEENYKIEFVDNAYYAVLFEENELLAISSPFASFIDAFVITPGGRPRDHVVGTMF